MHLQLNFSAPPHSTNNAEACVRKSWLWRAVRSPIHQCDTLELHVLVVPTIATRVTADTIASDVLLRSGTPRSTARIAEL